MDPVSDKTVFSPRTTAGDLFQTGEVVGQYRVERVLGQGGMGVVYLVQHTALKKNFALKVLPAALAKEGGFVARFKREAEMLGRLKHPHIVNVTDFGESLGRLYLVLEYVDGGSFEEWFEKNRQPTGGIPAAEVQRLIGQVLEGLAHAHQAGIVHRDLKPANVLLEKNGVVKISDFGLARVVADEEYRRAGGTASHRGDSVTTTGAIVGTIDFMSPEARNMRPSDLRSDIYALGVMTYYLLTGRKPSGIAQPATRLVPGLDLSWDKFIGSCLEEQPERRYQTATLALAALRLIPVLRRTNRWLMPLGVGVVLLASLGGWQWMESNRGSKNPAVSVPRKSPSLGVEAAATVAVVGKAGPQEVPLQRKFELTGLPQGAVVDFHGQKFIVTGEGRVSMHLPPGPQPVHIGAPGYVDWNGEIGGIENASEEVLTMQLVAPHTVRFTGLPSLAVLKIGDQTVTADSTGVAVAMLRPGRQIAAATAVKYQTLEMEIEVLPATETLALAMKRLPPAPVVVVNLPDNTELKFNLILPGEFYAGASMDERGRQRTDLERSRQVIGKGYYLAVTEMTQRQHRVLMGRNPSMSRAMGDDSRPVEQVAWRDLVGVGGVLDKMNEQLRKQGLAYKADLPTEMEWEYACRAGTETPFNDGSRLTNERDDPALNRLAFYSRGGAQEAPSPAAKFQPNAWGLYDMHGNVAEWVYGPRGARDPVLRGGNWKAAPSHCRSASRVELTPEARPVDTMGYRLLLRPTEE